MNYQPVFASLSDQDHGIIMRAMEECSHVKGVKYTRKYLKQYITAIHGEEPLEQSVCQMGKKYFVCDSDGTLSPCFHRMDVVLGNILTDSEREIEKKIAQSQFAYDQIHSCFGLHCVSLFDNPDFWR